MDHGWRSVHQIDPWLAVERLHQAFDVSRHERPLRAPNRLLGQRGVRPAMIERHEVRRRRIVPAETWKWGSNGDREADVDGVRQLPLSCGGSVVVLQQAAEPLAGQKAIVVDGVDRRRRHDQPIAQPLMVPFAMIVLDKLADGSSERVFTDENHPVQA